MHTDDQTTKTASSDIQRVLGFWFGELRNEMPVQPKHKIWFGGGAKLDEQIRKDFEPLVVRAGAGNLTDWQATARGTLALIVLLDQFPLNIYRKTARAYSFETQAIAICKAGLERRYDQELSIAERTFFYMPLQHSENLADQVLGVSLNQAMHDGANADQKHFTAQVLKSALEHQQTIEKFGRYPYRNAVLERKSTELEEAYLADNPQRYGQ